MNSEFIELNIKQGRGFLEGIYDYTMEAQNHWEGDEPLAKIERID